ncbi:MAG: carboxypeptidase-like regulatory domain-containing protein, partial [Bacteroidetes bacterium]|nr:carboxypeptidase-like regulatory domain-containing protein [Bacteroidota bacterium]
MCYYYFNFKLRDQKLLKALPLSFLIFLLTSASLFGQQQFKGKVIDNDSGTPLVGATVSIVNTNIGGFTSDNGTFSIPSPGQLPFEVKISYSGYENLIQKVENIDQEIRFEMEISTANLEEVLITTTVISERKNQTALTMETLSRIGIEQTSASSAYEGLGHLTGVDIATASFGMKVVNTRGFNSTQPVRSLQLIDGVDNQSPGLVFSLGNFLGASELDLDLVDLIVGASSAFYGPNAFNGVISMKTKDPFLYRGLAVSVKGGERNWLESAIRYAKVFKNKYGKDKLAIKANLFYQRADDWEADNYAEAYRDTSESNAIQYVGVDNPGGYDAENIYGDEVLGIADELGGDLIQRPGLGKYYRTGYEEKDLLDYGTQNFKAGL